MTRAQVVTRPETNDSFRVRLTKPPADSGQLMTAGRARLGRDATRPWLAWPRPDRPEPNPGRSLPFASQSEQLDLAMACRMTGIGQLADPVRVRTIHATSS